MTVERIVFALAGSFILLSLVLYLLHSHYWLWLTFLVGANLVQAAITGFCPSAKVLKFFGVKSGSAFK